MSVKPIPEGFHTITPYLIVDDANKVIEFLEKTFDAKTEEKLLRKDGSVANAGVLVGNSFVMMADAREEFKAQPAMLYVYVEDTDATYKKALEAGGTSVMEPADMFYGDRNAGVVDPCGNSWWIATHFEDVSTEELKKRQLDSEKTASEGN